jgi:hypothetical protein
MRRFLLTTALVFCAAIGAQANATTLKAAHAPYQHSRTARTRQAGSIPRVGYFIGPDTGLHCYNTGWASVCDGGVATGDEEPSPSVNAAQQAADQTQEDINASIAQTNGMQ